MAPKRIYASDLEKREALCRHSYTKNLPIRLEKARLRHLHIVRELRRNGLEHLFDDYEKGLV